MSKEKEVNTLTPPEPIILGLQLMTDAWLLRRAYNKQHSIDTAQQMDYPSAGIAVFKTGFRVHDLNEIPDFMIHNDEGQFALYEYLSEQGGHCRVLLADDDSMTQPLLKRLWDNGRALVHNRMGVNVNTKDQVIIITDQA